jgi:uridine kinase
MIIAIGGVSRSGKTSLARQLSDAIGPTSSIIHLDNFFKSKIVRKGIYNFDWEHPDSIDFRRLFIEIRTKMKSVKILIIEGFLISYDLRIRNIIDFYIHIDIKRNTFFKRRLTDYNEGWIYVDHVWLSYLAFGTNYQELNYIIVDGENKIDIQAIISSIKTIH